MLNNNVWPGLYRSFAAILLHKCNYWWTTYININFCNSFFPNFRLFYAKIPAKIPAKISNWPGPGLKHLSRCRDPGRLLSVIFCYRYYLSLLRPSRFVTKFTSTFAKSLPFSADVICQLSLWWIILLSFIHLTIINTIKVIETWSLYIVTRSFLISRVGLLTFSRFLK